jgi:hypothetical protein
MDCRPHAKEKYDSLFPRENCVCFKNRNGLLVKKRSKSENVESLFTHRLLFPGNGFV